jgi:hypothetical protein
VILAEKKVERQRHAHDIRYAKLMVSCSSYRACIYSSLLLFILYQIKSENETLQHKEREAEVCMQRNNSLMKKVIPLTLTSTPFTSLLLNLFFILFNCVLKVMRKLDVDNRTTLYEEVDSLKSRENWTIGNET